MTDVLAHIEAHLTAVEAAAKAATPGPWWASGVWYHSGTFPMENARNPWPAVGHGTTGADVVAHTARQDGADAAHIALNDPAAVLAWVAAIRAVVALHPMVTIWPTEERVCETCVAFADWPCPTIAAIATIWPADQEDA